MNSLRVIAGTARGRRLKSVPGKITRPITDRVKEALFNILSPDIQGARMLDLFAGTGAVGIEALSRGAEFVHFNDRHHQATNTIKENLQITELESKAKISQMDSFNLLKDEPPQKFDYVFIAPPQYKGLWKDALLAIDDNPDWLVDDGWIIVQIHPVEYEEVELTKFSEFDQRKYGSTILLFYDRFK